MSTGRSWTVGGVAHALPRPGLQAALPREMAFTDVRSCRAVHSRRTRPIERFASDRDRSEPLRAPVAESSRLPAPYATGLIGVRPDALHSNELHAAGLRVDELRARTARDHRRGAV